ncbi:MAG: hypothetical protein LBF87_00945 [Treponema sp.]|jgi:hypothetical protein|nr:hypothetical protein [Treponema sp.]
MIVNAPFTIVNVLFMIVNTPFMIVNAPFTIVNAPFMIVNTPFTIVNALFMIVNTPFTIVNVPFMIVNVLFTIVNTPPANYWIYGYAHEGRIKRGRCSENETVSYGNCREKVYTTRDVFRRFGAYRNVNGVVSCRTMKMYSIRASSSSEAWNKPYIEEE